MALPVAQALHVKGIRVCVFAMTTAIAVVDEAGLPYFTYADLPLMRNPLVQATGVRLAAEMPPGGPLPLAETIAYMGSNYHDMVVSLGVDKAAVKWGDGGRQNFHPRATMQAVISDLKPRLWWYPQTLPGPNRAAI